MTPMQRYIFVGAVLLLFAYEYQSSPSSEFVYQDYRWSDACAERAGTVPTSGIRTWPRSLMRLSWCWQDGQSPRAYHVVNLALHLIVSVLVGLLVWRLCGIEFAAWAGGALFLVHRMNIEAVAYASGRSELIAAIGIVGACLAVLSERWLLAAACVLFGVLGKESAVVAVAVLPLMLMAKGLRRHAVVMSVAVMLGVVLVMTRDGWPTPSVEWGMVQAMAAMRFSAMLFLPLGQTVDFDYALMPQFIVLAGSGLFIGAALLGWRLGKCPTMLSLAVGWLVITVLPRLFVVTPGMPFSEHQFYTPAISFPLAVGHVIHAYTDTGKL